MPTLSSMKGRAGRNRHMQSFTTCWKRDWRRAMNRTARSVPKQMPSITTKQETTMELEQAKTLLAEAAKKVSVTVLY